MEKFKLYEKVLKSELIVAMGCTEPIALSLSSCRLKEVLGGIPDAIDAYICGNIIKNAKSVTVPNTNGLTGLKSAIAAGLFAKDSKLDLEILSDLEPSNIKEIEKLLANEIIKVDLANSTKSLYIKLVGKRGNDTATVVIEDLHNNITQIKLNDKVLLSKEDIYKEKQKEYANLNVNDIYEFANTWDLTELEPYLTRQLEYNYNIAVEGIRNNYGARVGKTLLSDAKTVKDLAKAYTAAASDARMAGCDMPVVIVSGSGNQGITASVPLAVYAKEYNIGKDRLLRALIISNLVTLEEKSDIGRLSAFCGVISAGAAASAGIAYLLGGDLSAISHTIVNGLALASGIICDGAKSSCAGKIALALESGILGYQMYLNDTEFKAGEGIIKHGVDNTIKSVGRLARQGMKETDKEILKMMIED